MIIHDAKSERSVLVVDGVVLRRLVVRAIAEDVTGGRV